MTNRRRFLSQSAATGVFYIAKTSWAQKSPGDTVNVAVVGFGGRGGSHISGYRALGKEGVRVAALCDVDQKVLEKGVAGFKDEKLRPAGYRDIRKLLENKDIDVITIATPNHWHALATIWAMQAGKDVYVEKPVSHNVWEGRQIVEGRPQVQQDRADRHAVAQQPHGHLRGREMGAGRQPRQDQARPRPLLQDAAAASARSDGPQPVPDTVDYDLWCGPAPMQEPLHRKKLHYDWHWIWNYGNGDLGNQGIHQMDIARWFLGEMELARASGASAAASATSTTARPRTRRSSTTTTRRPR